MSATHRVAVNTLILYARMGITILVSLYTTRIILNSLGAEDFGIFNVVGGSITMLLFLNASMADATQRFMSFAQGERDPEKQKRIFNISLVLHAGIAVAVVILLELIGLVLFRSVFKISPERLDAAWMIYQYAAIGTFFTILAVPYEAVLTARENMLAFAVLSTIEALLKLSVALLIAHTSSDKLAFYGFWTAMITISLLVLRVIYCHSRYAECTVAPRTHFHRSLFGEMTSFAGWTLLGSSTSMIANYGQGVVLNSFFGSVVNAAQGIANQVSGQLSAFATTMLKALTPMIVSSEGAGDRRLMLNAAMAGTRIGFYLLLLFYVPMFIRMPYIFNLWLKNPPEYAIVFCRLLLLRNLIEQLFLPLVSAITAVGNIKSYQTVAFFLNLLPLPLAYLFFSRGYSPEWIYYSFLIYTVLNLWRTLYFARRRCSLSIKEYGRSALVPCALTIATYGILVQGLNIVCDPTTNGLIAFTLLSLPCFVLSVWLFGLKPRDREHVLAFARAILLKIRVTLFNSTARS